MRKVKRFVGAILVASVLGVTPGTTTPAYASTGGCIVAGGLLGLAMAGMIATAPFSGPFAVSMFIANLFAGIPSAAAGVGANCRH